MSRRRNTLKATSEELERIKARIAELRWTQTEDSQALIEASRIRVFEIIEKRNILKNYRVSIEDFKSLKYDKEIRTADEREYDRVLAEIDNCISSSKIDYLIEERVIIAKGISLRTYRSFLKTEPIDKFAFIAFWEVLGFDRQDISELQTKARSQGNQKPDRLYKALLSFDYREPCQHVLNICHPSRRSAAFFIPHPQGLGYQFSQVWLMRRIEQELAEYVNLETRKERFNLNLESEAATVENLWLKLGGKLQIRDGSEISERLKKHNLILVLDRIDTFDRTRLNELMNKFWQPLIQQASCSEGRLIMFLVYGGLPNDWRDDSALYDGVIKISAIPSFSVESLQQDCKRLEARVQEPINGKIEHLVRELIEYQNPEKCNLILQKIYQQFNCRFSAENRWQQYP
ncbi:hypothetical protein IQ235_03760 [Oscillatoriales cyanobacterium LEGE 11467]|uniref:Inactive STAND domain-containing protein n=1 Tax=Zarconia navalis LEGE 11467 TaxID=1828826 RepID=A0A928Z622_9CYAN|nr:hypothetical protein [Zarconia navalis]MBE9039907.1 hypothetical protein [Zarconia navalis LEGE 11467]